MSRHAARPQTGKRIKHGLFQFATYLLLFVGSAVTGWFMALTTMAGYWWLVPAVAIVLAPPTAFAVVKIERWKRYRKGSAALIKRYTQEIPIVLN
jgi:membrane protein YdbS with pleckstrin-like domain